jgi:cell division protein FtsB
MSFIRGGAFKRRSTASLVFGLFVVGGLVLVFAGTLTRSTDLEARAEEARAEFAVLEARAAAGRAEVEFMEEDSFIQQYARGLGYGKRAEIAFRLEEGSPSPQPITPIGNAPSDDPPSAPFEAWMELLFDT